MHRLATLALLTPLAACAMTKDGIHPRIQTVEEFRAARGAGDYDRASELLIDDPRIWYDEHVGEGQPWTMEPGLWESWDAYFNGVTERVTDWQIDDNQVWADMYETNDYFELTERGGGYWRATYFFRGSRIAGFMVSPIPEREVTLGRVAEFEDWAFEHHPEEASYLMPGGSIDPTGDRAPRMRELLMKWRATLTE